METGKEDCQGAAAAAVTYKMLSYGTGCMPVCDVLHALSRAVRVENGEEIDRELWVLLEELQERNQALAAENTALRARTPIGTWK